MGAPKIDIVFQEAAAKTIAKSAKGTVAIICRDGTAKAGLYLLAKAAETPTGLNQTNQRYVKQAFEGYVSAPKAVLLYVLPSAATDLTEALDVLGTRQFDYLVLPPDADEEMAQAAAEWIKTQRGERHAIYKAVLPHTAADCEGVVNFATDDIKAGGTTYAAAGYCARIAGVLAGTPMAISATYAPLGEVEDVPRPKDSEVDAAVDRGELVLIHDGEKVKVCRAVTSLTTPSAAAGARCKKIKVVEIRDLVQNDLRRAIQDGYIGKSANSYDDKCLLITAIRAYLADLERDGLLKKGGSTVDIDVDAQREYLRGKGVKVDEMDEQTIREADTDSHVFLAIYVTILDAMEDISITVHEGEEM